MRFAGVCSCASFAPVVSENHGSARANPETLSGRRSLMDTGMRLTDLAGAEGLEPPAYGFGDWPRFAPMPLTTAKRRDGRDSTRPLPARDSSPSCSGRGDGRAGDGRTIAR
jgi:hypothetical protein